MKTLFIADPIEHFDPYSETTFFLMNEACRIGHTVYHTELKNLFLENDGIKSHAKQINVEYQRKKFSYKIADRKMLQLNDCDFIFLRKDPPVDLKFIDHLSLLENLETEKRINNWTRPTFINSPSGIKRSNEKIYPLSFPGISPPSLVTASKNLMSDFIKKHRKVVIKPLNMCGGRGIMIVEAKDKTLNSLLEMTTNNFADYILMQKFVPAAKLGDKRVLIYNGTILGAFLRVPSKQDFRGNLHSGAKLKKTTVTAHERKLIQQITPRLLVDGLKFVGIDFIGPYITEINSTSPMGIREINQIDNSHVERLIFKKG